MVKRALFVLVIASLFALMLPFAVTAQDDGESYWPTDGWRTSTPEEQGMSSKELAKMFTSVSTRDVENLHNLLVIRHGYVVLDVSVFPFRPDHPHWTFSVTKSVIATLVGIAIDQGYIQGVDESIWDFFAQDATANMDDHKGAITIKHLLTHSTGLGLSVSGDYQMYELTANDESWVQFALDSSAWSDPGTSFIYLDAHAHLASAVVQEATGRSSLEYAQQYLFEPLGISDVVWQSDPQGVYWGGDGLALSPYSMAKLGYLYLRQGEWDDQQIVSSDWIEAATSLQIDQDAFWDGYGYFWWIGTLKWRDQNIPAYMATGLAGQEIWVVPDADLILVLTGDAGFAGKILIEDYILPAIVSATVLPSNPGALTTLEAETMALSASVASDVPSIASETMALSGRVYALEQNVLGWRSISLDIMDDEVVLLLDVEGTQVEVPVGLDGIFRISRPDVFAESTWLPSGPYWRPLPATSLAATGKWPREDRLAISVWDLSGGQAWSIQMNFGEPLAITILPKIEGSPVRIKEAE